MWYRLLSLLCLLLLLLSLPVCAEPARAVLSPLWAEKDFSGEDAIEQAILKLTNAERRKNHLSPLALQTALRTAARQHSIEMGERGYFSHESPVATWRRCWQRAYAAGFWGEQVGENIVSVQHCSLKTPEELAAHFLSLWMKSPGHRRNILDSTWTFLGVGVVKTGDTFFATQLFAATLVNLESAILTNLSGELVTLHLEGKAKSGLIDLWVNGAYQQSVSPVRGKWQAEISYPRGSGCIAISVAAGEQEVWTGVLDTEAKGRNQLRDIRVNRTDVVTTALVDTTPFTGVQLTSTVRVPKGESVRLLRNDCAVTTLTPDRNSRVTFTLPLPAREKPYVIGFLVGTKVENLLFVDASKPLQDAFQCRRE
ncbi:MAG: CAP domain-containing protein [Armatimonadota bacterium]